MVCRVPVHLDEVRGLGGRAGDPAVDDFQGAGLGRVVVGQ